jgi:hypothetical protein
LPWYSKRSTERSGVGVGDDPTAEDQHVAEVTAAQLLHHPWEQREVGAGQQRETDAVGVLLQHGLGDLLRRLVQAGVDDLEAVVAQGAGDGFCATVVAIETGLRHDDAIRALHEA